MHTLIVCGTPWCDLANALSKLQAAGLKAPESAPQGSIATIAQWHQRLFAHRPNNTTPVHPGKAWEQAAGQIFLANWEHPLWGWADHRSTWLLDFWHQFDPQTYFVFVHTPAADALVAAALDPHQSDFDATKTLDTWYAHQSCMLQYYLRHRDRCAWFPHLPANPDQITDDRPQSEAAPPAQIGTDSCAHTPDHAPTDAPPHSPLTLHWPVPIELTLATQPTQQPQDATLCLLRTLAQHTVNQHEEASALQAEIWASIPGMGDAPATLAPPPLQDQTAQLFNRVREIAVLQPHGLRQQLQEQTQRHQQLTQQIDTLRQQTQEQTTQLHAAQAHIETIQKARAEATEENELLLLQLHQVQEELEKIYLESTQLKQQLQTSTQARDTQAKANAELQAKLQQTQAAQAELSKKQEQQAKTAQTLQADLAKATQARDTQAKANAELQAKLQQTQAAQAELSKKKEQQAKTAQTLQADLAKATQAQAEATEENELLLLQLHQVQEELENYFLRHQEAQQNCQQLQQRLARWAQRYPDHCEWDSLAVLPHTQPHQQDLLITQLQHGSRNIAQLHLQLLHSKKQHQLVILRSTNQPAPLLHWPQTTAADGTASPAPNLVLNLRAQPHTPAATELAQLPPSDLQLLMAVCHAIAAQLPNQAPDTAAWAAHWHTTAQTLAALPPVWRYDHLSLRHEQVNPDYEHLWLHFDNAQYGQRRWPAFEFRLSASNVRKQTFSHLPKLEFPLPEAHLPKPFEHWLEESEDDKGPKFELRFDIKTPALDIQNWNTLSPLDQAQALDIVRQLPQFLRHLEQTSTAIHRPWADWHRMANGIRHALAQCLGIALEDPPATPPTPPAPAVALQD